MSDTVTIPTTVFSQMLNDLAFIKKAILPLAKSYKQSAWINEDEAAEIAGVGARTLRAVAKGGKIQFTTNAKKRGFKYKRSDVENYAQGFSSQTPNEIKNDEKLNQLKKAI